MLVMTRGGEHFSQHCILSSLVPLVTRLTVEMLLVSTTINVGQESARQLLLEATKLDIIIVPRFFD